MSPLSAKTVLPPVSPSFCPPLSDLRRVLSAHALSLARVSGRWFDSRFGAQRHLTTNNWGLSPIVSVTITLDGEAFNLIVDQRTLDRSSPAAHQAVVSLISPLARLADPRASRIARVWREFGGIRHDIHQRKLGMTNRV